MTIWKPFSVTFAFLLDPEDDARPVATFWVQGVFSPFYFEGELPGRQSQRPQGYEMEDLDVWVLQADGSWRLLSEDELAELSRHPDFTDRLMTSLKEAA